jgi:hypothetical protein
MKAQSIDRHLTVGVHGPSVELKHNGRHFLCVGDGMSQQYTSGMS